MNINQNSNSCSGTINQIQSTLISLYQLIKFQIQKKTNIASSKVTTNNSEITFTHLDPITIINYIKESIDILIEIGINERVDDYYNKKKEEQQEYESILIKYENDIRGHIKVEHQLKLYADNLQIEFEQIERKNKAFREKIEKYKKIVHEKTNTINTYEKEIQALKNENNTFRIGNKLLLDKEKILNDEITKLNSNNSTLIKQVQTLQSKISILENKPSSVSNIDLPSNVKNSGQISKRVISSMKSQLSKRNKICQKNLNNIMNKSLNNNNCHNYSMLNSTAKSISRQHEELMKKINDYNMSINHEQKKNQNINFGKNYHTNRSVDNFNSIHLIKNTLLKHFNKEPVNKNNKNNNIINKSGMYNNKSRMNKSISNNTSDSSATIIYHLNNNIHSNSKIFTKRRNNSNRKVSTSLIINNSTASCRKNRSISTTSPKQDNNNN